MYARTHAAFDPSRTLVARRQQTVHGFDIQPGKPFPKDEEGNCLVPEGTLRRLWVTYYADYAEDHKPTPVEGDGPSPEPVPEVTVNHAGGAMFEVKAPWASEPERVKGREAAETRAAELTAEGPPPEDESAENVSSDGNDTSEGDLGGGEAGDGDEG